MEFQISRFLRVDIIDYLYKELQQNIIIILLRIAIDVLSSVNKYYLLLNNYLHIFHSF